MFYRPQRSCEGYVFTPVCHSVHRGGLVQCMLGYHTPRSRHPPSQQMATVADGMHPTGMHSCYRLQMKLREGNVFTGVCDSVHRGVPGPGGVWSWEGGTWSQGVPGGAPPPDGYCCRRYASYWNAFLFGNACCFFRDGVVWAFLMLWNGSFCILVKNFRTKTLHRHCFLFGV